MLKENEEFRGFEIQTDKGGTLCAVFSRHGEPAYLRGMGSLPLATASTEISPEEWLNEDSLKQRVQNREKTGQDVSMSRRAFDMLRARKAGL